MSTVSAFLAALLHGTLVVSVSETVRRTEGATYIRPGAKEKKLRSKILLHYDHSFVDGIS